MIKKNSQTEPTTSHLRDELTNNELLMLNKELDQRRKNILLAYINALIFGLFGGHRFYLEKTRTALLMILITVLSEVRYSFITVIWLIIDLFLLPEMVRQKNLVIENSIAQEILERRQN
ncbi:TM2 domain-containing protein [Sporolactobacillus kofuensis]|uniref:TM2 domain-containing protein n=1 Tax=Sporolactobacillus kofuensis TaxID=269672 RepID=A0ABW1WA29_9BACL|nr:TM2 domain-containing protein [Sporolactobacillus kofuensis]MCO7174762.1 TM2 domain-containing protein [Sporolactobacillus kofuensis]